jgi:Protein of unknown function (DUF3108)
MVAGIRAGGGGGGHQVLARSTHAGGHVAAGMVVSDQEPRAGKHHVIISRATRRAIVVGLAVCGVGSLGASGDARAQGKLEARYSVTLAGVPFGQGSWTIDVGPDQYTAAVSGNTVGLVRIFASGQGSSAVRGTISNGQPIVSSYASSIQTDKKYDEVRMLLSAGSVKEAIAEPPTSPNPDRIPVTEAHRRGVTDPMTGAIIRVAGNGDTFTPEACHRKVAIFDGRMRYDLTLQFKRLDKVKAEKGYQGTVVVCALYFSPVAGHVPDRPVIKYLSDLRDAEVWFAPIAGTRLMVPYRAQVPTPFGTGVLQATQFVSVPSPQRASANGIRSQ